VLHRKEHAEHIGIEGRRVTLRGLFGHRTGRPLSAGIVDGDVEAAEPLDRLRDQRLHVALVSDVGANEFGFGVKRAQFGCDRHAGVGAATGDDDPSASAGEGQRRGTANAGKATGYQDDRIAHDNSPQG
jgi:hypothetical protein